MGMYISEFNKLAIKSNATQRQIAEKIDDFLAGRSRSIMDTIANRNREMFGVYLWGSVGSGKTMLMDLITMKTTNKSVSRHHFLPFMLDLRKCLSRTNNIKLACEEIVAKNSILCLDEFQVTDIADAMILQAALQALKQEKVKLICTSNRPPSELYLDGIQRLSFLPCIQFINTNMHLWNLSIPDHRMMAAKKDYSNFYWPVNDESEERVVNAFEELPGDVKMETLDAMGRPLHIRKSKDTSALIDYSEMFSSSGPADYIALCNRYGTLCMLNVPIMTTRDEARRFIDFIDICYEYRVKLIMQTAFPINELFKDIQGEESFAVSRAISRLHEMQYA